MEHFERMSRVIKLKLRKGFVFKLSYFGVSGHQVCDSRNNRR
jgi:hypothetical protein